MVRDIEQWRSLVLYEGSSDPSSSKHEGLASRLSSAASELFLLSLNHTRLQSSKSVFRALEREYGCLQLWCDGYGLARGDLDAALADSRRLRQATYRLLVSICSTLACRMAAVLLPGLDEASQRKLEEKAARARDVAEAATFAIHSADAAESDSDSGSDYSKSSFTRDNIFEDIVKDLKTDIQCLVDLGPRYKEPIRDRPVKEEVALPQPHTAWNPAEYLASRIRHRYPSVDPGLAQTLGQANWDRLQRLYARKETGDSREAQQTRSEPKSGPVGTVIASDFHDSGLGTSISTPSSYAETVLSYHGARGGSIKIPQAPIAALQGKPFECDICGRLCQLSKTNWKSSWKKHVLSDLQPYVCVVPTCSFSRVPFLQKKQWAHHLELEHGIVGLSGGTTCPLCEEKISSAKISHLARHLEEVSLTILPANAEPDEESDESPGEESDDGRADDTTMPRGHCRYVLLQPEIEGQRCTCVSFSLNKGIAGAPCDCGHLASFHNKDPAEIGGASGFEQGTAATATGRIGTQSPGSGILSPSGSAPATPSSLKLEMAKDDMMLSTEHEVRIKLQDGKSYVTDLDLQTLKRAEGFLNATDEEKGQWILDDPTEEQLKQMLDFNPPSEAPAALPHNEEGPPTSSIHSSGHREGLPPLQPPSQIHYAYDERLPPIRSQFADIPQPASSQSTGNGLGGSHHGFPTPKPCSQGGSTPAAPPMGVGRSKQGQVPRSKADSGTTPMSRAASMPRRGSTAGAKADESVGIPGRILPVKQGASTPQIPLAEDPWANATINPQEAFANVASSLENVTGNYLPDFGTYRSLTPNNMPDSSKDSGASVPTRNDVPINVTQQQLAHQQRLMQQHQHMLQMQQNRMINGMPINVAQQQLAAQYTQQHSNLQAAALSQMHLQQQQQQQQHHAQQQQQQQPQQGQTAQQSHMFALNNPAVQMKIRNQASALFHKNLPQLARRYNGGNGPIPEEALAEFKRNCTMQARAAVMNMLQQQSRMGMQAQAAAHTQPSAQP